MSLTRSIKPLPEAVHSSVRSGIMMYDSTRVIEELVFNSLDAGATKISVALSISTCFIKVVDNGYGVTRDGLRLLGEKYATSKDNNLSDVGPSFGYRGEALGSISDISLLEIITRTHGMPYGYRKVIKGCKCLYLGISDDSEDVGTTVIVRDLFYNQPVKRKHMQSSPKKVLHAVKNCILRIALVHSKASFRFVDSESEDELIRTGPYTSPLPLLRSGFGIDNSSSLNEIKESNRVLKLSGYISGPYDILSSKAFQYIYINSRFVSKGPIHKLVNELAIDFNSVKNSPQICPTFLLNITCHRSLYDITFEPSRTFVEFKDWGPVLTFIESAITRFWGENMSNVKHETVKKRRRAHEDSFDLCVSPLKKITKAHSIMEDELFDIEKPNKKAKCSFLNTEWEDFNDKSSFSGEFDYEFSDNTKPFLMSCLSRKSIIQDDSNFEVGPTFDNHNNWSSPISKTFTKIQMSPWISSHHFTPIQDSFPFPVISDPFFIDQDPFLRPFDLSNEATFEYFQDKSMDLWKENYSSSTLFTPKNDEIEWFKEAHTSSSVPVHNNTWLNYNNDEGIFGTIHAKNERRKLNCNKRSHSAPPFNRNRKKYVALTNYFIMAPETRLKYPQYCVETNIQSSISPKKAVVIKDSRSRRENNGLKWGVHFSPSSGKSINEETILDISYATWHGESLIPNSIDKSCLNNAKVLHQVDKKFIPIVAGKTLAIIDQHAADERIRLEELREKVLSGKLKTITHLDTEQELVLPEIGYQLLHNYAQQIQNWGWICNIDAPVSKSFTTNLKALHRQKPTVTKLTAVPCILGVNLTDVDLSEYLEQLGETDGSSTIPPAVNRILNNKACRGAIMFGDVLLHSECSLIVEELKQTSLCFQCAHGRPTTVPLVNLGMLHKHIAKLQISRKATNHGFVRHKITLERAASRLGLHT